MAARANLAVAWNDPATLAVDWSEPNQPWKGHVMAKYEASAEELKAQARDVADEVGSTPAARRTTCMPPPNR